MDARLAFWTFSLTLMAAAFGTSLWGVAAARNGQIESHRRRMKLAGFLIVAFVAGYGVKLAVIGREALETWAGGYVTVLRIHQFFIAGMLGGGLYALWLSKKTLSRDAGEREAARDKHRLAGRISITSFALALIMSAIIYWGMLQRAD